jgi:cytochrome b6-f complex iron-sulfur subunit
MNTEVLATLDEANDPGGVTRRRLFMGIGGAAVAATATGGSVVFLQFLNPNVLFEPPTRYEVGAPEDYPMNSVVSHRDIRVYVVRTVRGFFALSSICTHLGCITRWNEAGGTIDCPCHGSVFERNGNVRSGPAPRPLNHLAVSLEQDGQLVVDTAVKADPEFFLRV